MSREEDLYPDLKNQKESKFPIDKKIELINCIRLAITENLGDSTRLNDLLTFTKNIRLQDPDYDEQIDNNFNAFKNIITPEEKSDEVKKKLELIKKLNSNEIESIFRIESLMIKLLEYFKDERTLFSSNRLNNLLRAIYLLREEIHKISPLLLKILNDTGEIETQITAVENLILEQNDFDNASSISDELKVRLKNLKQIISMVYQHTEVDKQQLNSLKTENKNRIHSGITNFKDYIALVNLNPEDRPEHIVLSEIEDRIQAGIKILKKIRAGDSKNYLLEDPDQDAEFYLDSYNLELKETLLTLGNHPFDLLNQTLIQIWEIIIDDQMSWKEKENKICSIELFQATKHSSISDPAKLKGLIDTFLIEALKTHYRLGQKIKDEESIDTDRLKKEDN